MQIIQHMLILYKKILTPFVNSHYSASLLKYCVQFRQCSKFDLLKILNLQITLEYWVNILNSQMFLTTVDPVMLQVVFPFLVDTGSLHMIGAWQMAHVIQFRLVFLTEGSSSLFPIGVLMGHNQAWNRPSYLMMQCENWRIYGDEHS